MKDFNIGDYLNEGQTIHIFSKRPFDGTQAPHRHDFIEIVYIRSGEAEEIINDVHYDVKHGDLIFINYGSIHAFTARQLSYVNICFSPKVMGNTAINPQNALSLLSFTAFHELCGENTIGGKLSFTGKERREIETILDAMLSEKRERLPMYDGVLESYMNILITKMLRQTEGGIAGGELGEVWDKLLTYIDNNLGEKLTLPSLAEKCFYNPSYFSRIFKEKFGISPVEYINRKRVRRAEELLSRTGMTVDEISAAVGFSDKRSFYYAFEKYNGGVPSEYRRQTGK